MSRIGLGIAMAGLLAGLNASCVSASHPSSGRGTAGAHGRWPSRPAGPRSPSRLVARAWAGREPPATWRGWAVVAFASRQVGKPYCWGGTGPRCFDCSGLVQRAWASAGVALPRTADAIASRLDEVPLEDVRTGDVLWWPGHVGLYAGNGWTIEALDARDGIVRRPARDPLRAFRPREETARARPNGGGARL